MVRRLERQLDTVKLIQSHLRSPPVNIEDIGSVHLRMRARVSDDIRLVRADVQIDGSTIFVAFCQADEGWPFTIENDSDYTISMAQTVSVVACQFLRYLICVFQDGGRGDQASSKSIYTLTPRSHLNYAWDFPAARDKKLSLTINGARRFVDPMEIGDLVPFKFHVNRSISFLITTHVIMAGSSTNTSRFIGRSCRRP